VVGNGFGISLWNDESVLNLDSDDGSVAILRTTELIVHLKICIQQK
jgi:hypothetical protein